MNKIFLGEPPASIKAWIVEHYSPAPAGHAETWIKFSENDSWHEYNIEGAMDCPALIAAGLMLEGSGEMGPPEWTTQPYAVEIGTSVASIGSYAFFDCSELTSVTIPDSVTSIERDVFSGFLGCSGLMSIIVNNGNPNYSSANGLLLSKDGKTLIQGVNGDVTIPDSVTSIGYYAFENCSGLTSVTIPDSVTSIGSSAFYGCSGLTSVTITANGGNANNVKQAMIDAGVDSNITWNMPS